MIDFTGHARDLDHAFERWRVLGLARGKVRTRQRFVELLEHGRPIPCATCRRLVRQWLAS